MLCHDKRQCAPMRASIVRKSHKSRQYSTNRNHHIYVYGGLTHAFCDLTIVFYDPCRITHLCAEYGTYFSCVKIRIVAYLQAPRLQSSSSYVRS